MAVAETATTYGLPARDTVERGIGIIINNRRFQGRMGNFAVTGAAQLRIKADLILAAMGITSITRPADYTKEKLLASLKARARFANQHHVKMVVLVIGTHGNGSGHLATLDDWVHLFGDILPIFDDYVLYPNLVGVPKVVYIDACDGPLFDHHNQAQVVNPPIVANPLQDNPGLWRIERANNNAAAGGAVQVAPPPALSDCFVYRAAVPGHLVYIDEVDLASVFIQSLTETVTETTQEALDRSMIEIFLNTQRKMAARSMDIEDPTDMDGFIGKFRYIGSLVTTMSKNLYPLRL